MAPLGFVMLFGNEDTANWTRFWKFVISEHPIVNQVTKTVITDHPIVNQVTKTVITDQDKGALTAIRQVVPDAGQFHCAFHWCQNITKKFGGGEENSPLTCLWMFNILVKCSSVSSIRYLKSLSYTQMRLAHTAYLDALRDDQQYPAARCHKSDDDDDDDVPNIYMFGKTALSDVESMNCANEDIRKRTTIDLLNAAIILIKKEGVRFKRGQSDANKVLTFTNSILTPRGIALMEEIFQKCESLIYRLQMTEHADFHKFVVSKNSAATREYFVQLPKFGVVHGSRFGTCSCGFPKKEGIPCDHMVAIVKSGTIPNLTRVQLMPFWYTRAQWQLQFPNEVVYQSDITWQNIRKTTSPDQNTKYCPGWAAPKKKGRPKKDTRKLGIADHVQEATAKRRRRNYRSNSAVEPKTIVEEVNEDNTQHRDCTV
jgi:hypothetical protein